MMGRLTKRAGGTVVYAGGYKQYEGGDIPAEVSPQGVRELLVRLAEYEDTGVAPEDVLTVHEMAQIYSLVEENKAYRAMGIRLDRLEEIASEDKECCVIQKPQNVEHRGLRFQHDSAGAASNREHHKQSAGHRPAAIREQKAASEKCCAEVRAWASKKAASER